MPLDRKQRGDAASLTIEETYELADAITSGDWKGIGRSWGPDAHIVFYARIGKEQGKFTLEDVIDGICEKRSPHPHIYGISGQEGLVARKG